ncbi:MAG: hypothetical protein QOH90_1551 [Actinomycetota bacterium]|nr:hypothetical protein [Actinomycetota bacterium]
MMKGKSIIGIVVGLLLLTGIIGANLVMAAGHNTASSVKSQPAATAVRMNQHNSEGPAEANEENEKADDQNEKADGSETNDNNENEVNDPNETTEDAAK